VTTDPWASDTATLLRGAVTHVAGARVITPAGDDVPLVLERVQVTFDEQRAPRCTAVLTCAAPTDLALLERIDPRTLARVEVTAGYARPDGLTDSHPLATLGLRRRRVDRPSDSMDLDAAGDEALVTDAGRYTTGTLSTATTAAAIAQVITDTLPGATVVTTVTDPGPAVSGLELTDADRWDLIDDHADQIDVDVYDDGTASGTWTITDRPTLTTPTLELTVGLYGTILTSQAGLTRDDPWANEVILRHEWTPRWSPTPGETRVIVATGRITSGPYIAAPGNTRQTRVERKHPTTQAQADAAALSIVARTVTRGRSLSLRAVAAYWLRPGMTIGVQLPLGDMESHLVAAVTFDPGAGVMDITTRVPDNTGTIGA
jgi:hypothetical protein